MKKFLFFISFAMGLSFAEVGCYENITVQIHFRDPTIWSRDGIFLSGCYAVVNDTLSETLIDGYKCFKEWNKAEKVYLDSNVFLFRDKESYMNVYSLSIYSLYEAKNDVYSKDVATHNIGDVFKDEFLHWQQCGMLSLTYEEADSLATSLVEPLNDFVKGKIGVIETDAFVVEDNPHANPSQISQWIEETCAKVQPQSPPDTGTNPNNKEPETPESLQRLKSANMGVVFENHVAHIPEYLRGEKFFIFDMTGKVAQKGFAEETIQLPDSPSILKIGARKPILCK